VADDLRRGGEPRHVRGGWHHLHLAAERAQPVGDEGADAPDAVGVAAARLDGDELAQRVEERLLLFPRLRPYGVGRLGAGGAGEREEQEGDGESAAHHVSVLASFLSVRSARTAPARAPTAAFAPPPGRGTRSGPLSARGGWRPGT